MSSIVRIARLAKWLLPVLVLAAGFGGMAALYATKPVVSPAERTETVQPVSAVRVETGRHRPMLQAIGEVVATRSMRLQMPVAGRVVEMSPRLRSGDRVAEGEVLLKLDTEVLSLKLAELRADQRQALARVAELELEREAAGDMLGLARERLQLQERDLARQQRLRGGQFTSERTLDSSRNQLNVAETTVRQDERTLATLAARIDQQKAAVERLAATVTRAERDLADAELQAPFPGLVGDVEVAPGKELKAGDGVAELIDERSFEVRFTLNDADFGRLWVDGLIGRPVRASWRLGKAGFVLEGKVDRVAAKIDATAGGVLVHARLDYDPTRVPLRAGILLEIELPDREVEAFALPTAALYPGNLVYAIVDGKAEPRTVDVLAQDGQQLLVRGGIRAGEQVLTSQLPRIAPGKSVAVVSP